MRHPLFSSLPAAQSRHGIALISVLIIVALITAVVIGFIVTAGQEMTSSRSYSASAGARLMGDTAINLVQAQINQATSQGTTYSWASQPGAIRVYDSTGNLNNIYKLYSAQSLTTTTSTPSGTAGMDTGNATTTSSGPDIPPTAWASDPALWVDLNAPANDPLGNQHFPIFDEGKAANVDGFAINGSIPGATTNQPVPMPVIWLYVLQNGQIIAPDPGSTGTVATFTQTASGIQPSVANPIVGRIAYWTDDETCKVNINTAGGDGYMASGSTDPTPIANANFWDTPHYSSYDDYGGSGFMGFAAGQPAAGEFQRYPGHPAAVALNNVLYGLGWTLPTSSYAGGTMSFYNNGTTQGITPRYTWGGSEDGTLSTIKVSGGGGSAVSLATSIPLVPNPQNRLYSSVAEMLFTSTRTPSAIDGNNAATRQQIETARFFLTAHSQAPEVNLFGEPRVSIWPVWAAGAKNGFNGSVTPTPIDKLFCFASTVNGNGPTATQYPYYFVRGDSTSTTTDIGYTRNQVLLSYLDTLTSTPIPGYGSDLQSTAKYGQAGTRQILAEIFDYIRTINEADTSQPLVGGVNLQEYAREWGQGSSITNANGWYQVAPSVITNTSASTLNWGGTYQGFGAYPRLNEIAIQFIALGEGALATAPTPAPAATYYMNGAYANYVTAPTLSATRIPELPYPVPAAPFAPGDYGTDPEGSTTQQNNVVKLTKPPWTSAIVNYVAPPGNTVEIQAFILLDFTNPSQMFMNDGCGGGIIPYLYAEIKGLDQFTVTTKNTTATTYPLGFPSDDAVLMTGNMSGGGNNNNWDCINFAMPIGGKQYFLAGGTYPDKGPGILNGEGFAASFYTTPFYSHILPLAIPVASTNGAGTFFLTGNTITVNLYDGGTNGPNVSGNVNSGTAKLVQTYTIDFASNGATLPLPVVVPPVYPAASTTPPYTPPTGFGVQVGIQNGAPYTGGTNGTSATYDTDGYDRWDENLIVPGDTVESMVLSPQWSDIRELACANVSASAFIQHPAWGTALACTLFNKEYPDSFLPESGGSGVPGAIYTPPYPSATLGPGVLNPNTTTTSGATTTISGFQPYVPPELSATVDGQTTNFPKTAGAMDWDTGIGCLPDGPWINKVDEGNVTTQNGGQLPYYQDTGTALNSSASLFSPNHEVPSPGMFGSLSTGVDPTGVNPTPWRTLLFRPAPPGGHLGGVSPEDHTLLDLFWMPVEEPYAISEPFTSSGKINLNYQIQPFTYITRSTAIRAVLNSEKVAAVSVNSAKFYKNNSDSVSASMPNARYALNVPVTLTQFDDKFNGTNNSGVNLSATPDIFHSASQICDMYLVPLNPPELPAGYTSVAAFATKWYDGVTYGLVGDNVRERPYTNIYGQITTKSNSYTVYYTVQALKNAEPQTNATPGQQEWDETKGSVVGEYRGSTTIERYIDPNQTLPDFAANAKPGQPVTLTVDGSVNASPPQASYYNWRIVDNHQFAP